MLRRLGEKHTDTVFVECFEPRASPRGLPARYWYHQFFTNVLAEASIPAASTTAPQRRYPTLPAAFLTAGPGLYKQELEKEIKKKPDDEVNTSLWRDQKPIQAASRRR